MTAMKGYHSRWGVPDEHRESAEYIEAGARIALGQAVYDRRIALGLSQSELARRAGTTQTVISRLEGGAVTPTLPLLHRLAGALEGELNLTITGTSTRAEFPLAS
jgi:transcriptional regulator with XRE-family HTH domain